LRNDLIDSFIALSYENPYRDVVKPLMSYVYERERILKPGENLTVVMIKFVTAKWYDRALHNQTRYFLEQNLSHFKNVSTVLVTVPLFIQIKPHQQN